MPFRYLAACGVVASLVMAGSVTASDTTNFSFVPPQVVEPIDTGVAELDGTSLYYQTFGDRSATPLLMIHGGVGNASVWNGVVGELADEFYIITADTRGHGRSTNDGSVYSYFLLAEDYSALLDKLGLERVALIGFSDGANVGYQIALSQPERLSHLFAQGGNVRVDGIDPGIETDPVFGAYFGAMAEQYAELTPSELDFEAFTNAVVAMWGTNLVGSLSELSDVTVPVAVVHGENEEAILRSHAEAIAQATPNSQLIIIPDVGHFAALQDPERYAQAIRDFVR